MCEIIKWPVARRFDQIAPQDRTRCALQVSKGQLDRQDGKNHPGLELTQVGCTPLKPFGCFERALETMQLGGQL